MSSACLVDAGLRRKWGLGASAPWLLPQEMPAWQQSLTVVEGQRPEQGCQPLGAIPRRAGREILHCGKPDLNLADPLCQAPR